MGKKEDRPCRREGPESDICRVLSWGRRPLQTVSVSEQRSNDVVTSEALLKLGFDELLVGQLVIVHEPLRYAVPGGINQGQ